jgi:hypothetical protein
VGSERLDLPRIGLATIVAAGLALGLARVFLRHAQSTSHVGPTSATLDEAFSLLAGAALGMGLGRALRISRRGAKWARLRIEPGPSPV